METKCHHYTFEVSGIEMEISGIHEAFLGDWLVFLCQAVLHHVRHDGRSIHDKCTKGHTATSVMSKPKQKLVASSHTAEQKLLKKAI